MSTTTLDPTLAMPPAPPRSTLPPGSRLPPLLQAATFARDPIGAALRLHRRFGEPFALRSAGFPASVVYSSPDLVRQIVAGPPGVFHAGLSNQPLKPVLGPWSLLVLDRAPHMQQRKLLLPPFHGERLRSYGQLIRELAEREVAAWPVGEPFRLDERMQALTLEVILEVVFGIADEARKDDMRRLMPPTSSPAAGSSSGARSPAATSARSSRTRRSSRGATQSTRCCTARSPSGAGSTPPRSRSATTSSRCSSAHSTRTARRWATERSATS